MKPTIQCDRCKTRPALADGHGLCHDCRCHELRESARMRWRGAADAEEESKIATASALVEAVRADPARRRDWMRCYLAAEKEHQRALRAAQTRLLLWGEALEMARRLWELRGRPAGGPALRLEDLEG